jgi:hypothetical protein
MPRRRTAAGSRARLCTSSSRDDRPVPGREKSPPVGAAALQPPRLGHDAARTQRYGAIVESGPAALSQAEPRPAYVDRLRSDTRTGSRRSAARMCTPRRQAPGRSASRALSGVAPCSGRGRPAAYVRVRSCSFSAGRMARGLIPAVPIRSADKAPGAASTSAADIQSLAGAPERRDAERGALINGDTVRLTRPAMAMPRLSRY